jgi:archaellum biogenesis ATPase FlaH
MVEVATGHVSNRHQVILLEDVKNYIFPPEQKTESYHSWYQFDEQLEQHIKATGTIQGYNGVYYVNRIILDYDVKDLSDDNLYNAVRFLVETDMVSDLGIKPEHILIWFSGTGFHIEIPDLFGFPPSVSLPGIVKQTLSSIFPDCDVIYDGARLIRANFSFNTKKGNFKVPFTYDEFMSTDMSKIQRKSSSLNDGNKEIGIVNKVYKSWVNVDSYLKEFIKYPELSVAKQTTVRSDFKIDSNNVVTCMQSVLGAPPPVGERNDTMMRIASWMRRNGMPLSVVEHTLTEWSGLPKEAQRTAARTFEEKYEYSCSDYVMSKHCKPNCIYFKHKDFNLNIVNPKDMEINYKEFMAKDFTNMAFNFADIYQMDRDFWVFPGELVIVTGSTGLGKSTWVMNLVAKLTKMTTLFLSLENSFHLTFRRFVQMTHSMSKAEVMKEYRGPKQGKLVLSSSKKKENYYEAFKHIHVLCEAPELSKLTETIARIKPKLVVVDTTDMVYVKGIHDEIGKMNEIINGLKATAQSQECIIIAVHHVNKQAMHDGVTTITSLKGTTNVVQKADKVLVLNGENNEDIRSLHSEKARDDGNMKIMFNFDKRDMTFKQIGSHSQFVKKEDDGDIKDK